MHPNVADLLEHFNHAHLPPALAAVSEPCGQLARTMAAQLDGPELTVGLRKLLEAKDCFVRALVVADRKAKAAAAGG